MNESAASNLDYAPVLEQGARARLEPMPVCIRNPHMRNRETCAAAPGVVPVTSRHKLTTSDASRGLPSQQPDRQRREHFEDAQGQSKTGKAATCESDTPEIPVCQLSGSDPSSEPSVAVHSPISSVIGAYETEGWPKLSTENDARPEEAMKTELSGATKADTLVLFRRSGSSFERGEAGPQESRKRPQYYAHYRPAVNNPQPAQVEEDFIDTARGERCDTATSLDLINVDFEESVRAEPSNAVCSDSHASRSAEKAVNEDPSDLTSLDSSSIAPHAWPDHCSNAQCTVLVSYVEEQAFVEPGESQQEVGPARPRRRAYSKIWRLGREGLLPVIPEAEEASASEACSSPELAMTATNDADARNTSVDESELHMSYEPVNRMASVYRGVMTEYRGPAVAHLTAQAIRRLSSPYRQRRISSLMRELGQTKAAYEDLAETVEQLKADHGIESSTGGSGFDGKSGPVETDSWRTRTLEEGREDAAAAEAVLVELDPSLPEALRRTWIDKECIL
ncbi:hypothetical protein BAUCODRAFT_145716 [Baudoinia panamericana UAMH 10762]|uniref:Uncharacterized protein n=1 Tax=Baudoinia panamericana (strain UAMH 10762) TaxID=717646 RepID=M2LVJ6_BAUPA|nr:uncharacterized protein BAUCODRAFT_145716 [Baudoinia panamericana UAMH 10762]EMC98672.1 hypothetical protein BAUCODRAFT_145716 [Baudoinia panamericana UAMH 10762]